MAEFARLGWESTPAKKQGRKAPAAALDRVKLVSKIEAFLAEAKRSWAYADGMALRMFKVERVEWLDPQQLQKMVAALTYDARRHSRPER